MGLLAIFVCHCGRHIEVELDVVLAGRLQDTLNSYLLLEIICYQRLRMSLVFDRGLLEVTFLH